MSNQAGPANHRRGRRRRWLLLAVGGVFLVAIVWSAVGGPGLQTSPLPEPPAIPDPNGYDDALAAGREIEKTGLTLGKLDIDKMDQAALEPVVEGCRESIARGRKGLEKPFQVPVVYDLTHIVSVLMKDLGSIRGGLVRGLRAQGRLAELQGRIDLAADCFADEIRLGDAMSHRVPMIAYLVAVAVQSTGLHQLRDIRARLSPEQCRQMIALLEETDGSRELGRDVLRSETLFMSANLKKLGFFAGLSMRISGMHTKNLAQVASTLDTVENRQNASRRVLLTDLALRVYHQAHGEDPPDLNALVPSILKSVPLDPYTDKPLRYSKRGKDGVVYSVGPDRVDNGLGKTLVLRHTDTTAGDFTIDSF